LLLASHRTGSLNHVLCPIIKSWASNLVSEARVCCEITLPLSGSNRDFPRGLSLINIHHHAQNGGDTLKTQATAGSLPCTCSLLNACHHQALPILSAQTSIQRCADGLSLWENTLPAWEGALGSTFLPPLSHEPTVKHILARHACHTTLAPAWCAVFRPPSLRSSKLDPRQTETPTMHRGRRARQHKNPICVV